MNFKRFIGPLLAGACAGTVTGLLGAGGGMVLVPLLALLTNLEDDAIFPTCVSVILPVCLVCLGAAAFQGPLPFSRALPYLLGSAAGGFAAGILGRRIPTVWLHRILGGLILWGGIRYLC